MDIQQAFKGVADEYLEFERVTKKLHARPDLCAFLILDSLVPGATDMIRGAGHDEISLAVRTEALAKVATYEDIRDLVRCGVMIDNGVLTMFV